MSEPEQPMFDREAFRSVRSRTEEMRSANARMITIIAREDEDGTIELIYLFDRGSKMTDFRFRILPDWEVDSVADIIPAAMNMERELVDLFGIRYKGVKPALFLEPGKSPLSPLRKAPKADKEVKADG